MKTFPPVFSQANLYTNFLQVIYNTYKTIWESQSTVCDIEISSLLDMHKDSVHTISKDRWQKVIIQVPSTPMAAKGPVDPSVPRGFQVTLQTCKARLFQLFRRRSKETSKLRVTGLCVGNSPGTGEFPAQRASNAENISIGWRHHEFWHWNLIVFLGSRYSHWLNRKLARSFD